MNHRSIYGEKISVTGGAVLRERRQPLSLQLMNLLRATCSDADIIHGLLVCVCVMWLSNYLKKNAASLLAC